MNAAGAAGLFIVYRGLSGGPAGPGGPMAGSFEALAAVGALWQFVLASAWPMLLLFWLWRPHVRAEAESWVRPMRRMFGRDA